MKKILMLLLLSLVLLGCTVPEQSGNDDDKTKDLPIETKKWNDDGNGFVQFYTNDPANYETNFFAWNTDLEENPMVEGELQVKKISGDSLTPFGGVFCLTNADNFYFLVIDIAGYYYIGKRTDGTYSEIKDWTQSALLNTGYNVINTLRTTYEGSNTFKVYLNGTQVYEFTDNTDPHTGGYYGLWASVNSSDYESFPNTPVDVRFKVIKPAE